MRLEHITGLQAGYTMGMDKEGREHLVVCIKSTYTIPKDGSPPQLVEEQVPLVFADEFAGEPGFSAPVYESDYAPFKPRCDVLLNGSAYAPGAKPATQVQVALQFGQMKKSFKVVGDRFWRTDNSTAVPTPPKPFLRMPVSYDRAFGGVDDSQNDPEKVRAILENPVGVGYHHYTGKEWVHGKPLPNCEELRTPVTRPDRKYRPMSFGPIGRGWQPRAPLAGTYDQNWLDNIFPFLPPDFDNAYFQSAPLDQQVPYPQGGEPVFLINLTPTGRTGFSFPRINLLVWFFLKDGDEKEVQAVVDTVMLEPDRERFTATSRASLPLRRNMFEVELVVFGHDPHDKQRVVPDQVAFPMLSAFDDEEGATGTSGDAGEPEEPDEADEGEETPDA